MIRDPSDGTVKEKHKSDWVPGAPPEKTEDEKQRLDKSREWLKEWKSRGPLCLG